jgi:retron-type reverse transcriptase
MRGEKHSRLLHDGHGRHARAICYLVVPLAHEATDMRMKDTARPVAGKVLRSFPDDRQSPSAGQCKKHEFSPTARTTPGTRISTMATRTTTTRTTTTAPVLSADGSATNALAAPHADFSFLELIQAYLDCRRTKRNSVAALIFESNLESNLRELFDELHAGTYRPSSSICFVITRPKPREVWAAPFEDRIVHHLLYNRIAQRFHRSFIADSCACIPGRGTLYAAHRLEAKVRSQTRNWKRPAWYLKCDVANFFVSIDKTILRELIAKRVTEAWWLQLTEAILFHDPRADVELHCPPHRLALIPALKSLFNQPAHLGLPIGNLSSQFFANVYLDVLDQFVKHELRARHYVRYVDDFVLLHESPQWLNDARERIEAFLPERLGVQLNPRKTILQPIERGIDFAGYVIKPWHRTIRRRTFNDALARTAASDPDDLFETANSYFGLLRQATHGHYDRARLANVLRKRGHSVNQQLTQTYRRTA